MSLHVELLFLESCPHVEPARALLQRVVDDLGVPVEIEEINVATAEQAQQLGFLGSPSIRIEGRDVEELPAPAGASMSCRTYDSGGLPPRWMVEAAVLRALASRSYLFLCVANSARSQMAEGIARSLAPKGTTVASAGSEPSRIRPEAIEVLAEAGIDISAHRSKSLEEIDPAGIDVVVTLCTEEVCPVFLGQARRVHWGLPDPAATEGDRETRLAAFRAVRNELRRRLSRLFCTGQ
jgi:arsenate reductase